ncbi:Rieske 2Fe-2S domain-containing protein [Rugosimonospora acidiphila]|uniref:Rieske 2Fe-2S domain-containing protein n=1 Tax=Rugosimonospora acidiphila TaxID=556531 RepID=A0ABP9SNS6_9ACTN
MLSEADNALLTQTGPGTPMGTVFRSFWIPALLSKEVPERDGTPVRVGLLGEKLVAFRDTSGRVGLLEARCPHRHANLFWGRNEDNGLRCVYHGWKFTVDGTCVDMPAEPADSTYKDRLRAVAYPTHEAGGIVWAYLGDPDNVPPFPAFDWTFLPEGYSYATKRLQQCNYFQNLEGELDSSHNYFLHREFQLPENGILAPEDMRRPDFYIAEAPHGLLVVVKRNLDSGNRYYRITPFMMPSYTIIPTEQAADEPDRFTAAVPLDDHNMWGYTVSWRRDRPLNEAELEEINSGRVSHAAVDPDTFIPLGNLGNDYLIDREAQRTRSFTGIPGVRVQDLAVQEDQDGPVCRRFEEHLGTTDRAIVATRRLMLRAARQVQQGTLPPQRDNASSYRLRSLAVEADSSTPWEDLWRERQGADNPDALPAKLEEVEEWASVDSE